MLNAFCTLLFLIAGVYFLFIVPYMADKDLKNHKQAREYGLCTGNLHVVSVCAIALLFTVLEWSGVMQPTSKFGAVAMVYSIILMSVGMGATILISFNYLLENTRLVDGKKYPITIVVALILMLALMLSIVLPQFLKGVTTINDGTLAGVVYNASDILKFFVVNVSFLTNRTFGPGLIAWMVPTYVVLSFMLMPKEAKSDWVSWVTFKPSPE